MKLLFENWRKYLTEAGKPTSHPLPASLQFVPGAYRDFKAAIDLLIEKFQNREGFISELWKLYRASDATHMQASEILLDIMNNHDLPEDIDNALLDFAMELTGPMENWPKEENV